jgi:PiT family inorganic phosphate transporter
MFLILTVIFVALVFTYINGFHDTANSIATVVSTKVLTPRQAVLLAAVTNLVGAFFGTAVATTIASGIIDTQVASMSVLCCALLGAIAWNLVTWWVGLPSSSSHALVGGLCGAALAASGNRWSAIIWSIPGKEHWWKGQGVLWKVVVPMIISPAIGFVVGFTVMAILYFLLRRWRPVTVNRLFGKLQLVSAAYMGFAHGTNDAQKTMGVITLAMVVATKAGMFASLPHWMAWLQTPEGTPAGQLTPVAWVVTHLPSWLQFGYRPKINVTLQYIPVWITVLCGLTMCAGTAAGGWRIIRTLGHKMVRLHPVHGFAAEATAASILFTAARAGMPVSTTHVISTSIMGVGCAKGFNALKLQVVERIVWAWVLTLPASAAVAYALVCLARSCGWL